MVRQWHMHLVAAAALLLGGFINLEAASPVTFILFLGALIAVVSAKMARLDERLGGC